VNLSKTRSRLLNLCSEFEFAPMGEVLEHIAERTGESVEMVAAK
jgi:hypothetical protein